MRGERIARDYPPTRDVHDRARGAANEERLDEIISVIARSQADLLSFE